MSALLPVTSVTLLPHVTECVTSNVTGNV